MRKVGTWLAAGAALLAVVHALSTDAGASFATPVPEIGPGSLSAGLAILAGGILMVRARRQSK
jgi:hypothetical protein